MTPCEWRVGNSCERPSNPALRFAKDTFGNLPLVVLNVIRHSLAAFLDSGEVAPSYLRRMPCQRTVQTLPVTLRQRSRLVHTLVAGRLVKRFSGLETDPPVGGEFLRVGYGGRGVFGNGGAEPSASHNAMFARITLQPPLLAEQGEQE